MVIEEDDDEDIMQDEVCFGLLFQVLHFWWLIFLFLAFPKNYG